VRVISGFYIDALVGIAKMCASETPSQSTDPHDPPIAKKVVRYSI
jgi:hypothetical protein